MSDWEVYKNKSEVLSAIREFAESHRNFYQLKAPLVAVPIMQGGFFFAAHLLQQLNLSNVIICPLDPHEVDWDHWCNQFDEPTKKAEFLLIDDILETGATQILCAEKLQERGIENISGVCFVDKKKVAEVDKPHFIATVIDAPDKYLYGFGMDSDKGEGRCEPVIFAHKQRAYDK